MGFRVPLDNPKPDARGFINYLMGREKREKPPLVEYIIDWSIAKVILEEMIGKEWVDYDPNDREKQSAFWDNYIELWYRLGYDFVKLEIGYPFEERHIFAPDTASQGIRSWVDEHQGAIMSWEDFEAYRWPTLDMVDFFPYEYIASHLPEGMGLIASHSGGIYEHLSWIMSYEGLSYALYDDPALVEAVANKLGQLMEEYYEKLLKIENIIAIFPGDDMGFKSGTLIHPDYLRKYILPWHKRFAEMAHSKGIPYFLHSCGNVEAIMEDLIEDVRIDGKHSFEDVIIPAWEFHRKYGGRIATLGGVDVNVLASATPSELRKYVRNLIDKCAPLGRFAVGSGNSIPNYIPLENFLTMLDEALA
jgi:uroporphyrinogen decarboxylase